MFEVSIRAVVFWWRVAAGVLSGSAARLLVFSLVVIPALGGVSVSVASGAKAGAEPLEVAPLRSLRSVTEQLPDGSFVTHLTGAPVNFRAGPKAPFEPADVSLVAATGAGGFEWETKRAGYSAKLGSDAAGESVSFAAGGVYVSVSLEGASAARGNKQTSRRVGYAGVFAQTDIRYDAIPAGLKETLILKGRQAPGRFSYLVRPAAGEELVARERPDGSVEFAESDGAATAFRVAAPVAYDANLDRGGVSLQATPAPAGGVRLVVSVDQAWLSDPKRVFPVEVDPTWETDIVTQDGFYDTTVGGNPDVSSAALFVGKNGAAGSAYQGVVTYDLAAIPRSAKIVSATAQLYVAGCLGVSCPATANDTVNGMLELHALTSGWSSATPWASVNQSATVLASKSMNIGVSGGDAVNTWVSLTSNALETAIQDIVTGATANHGFALQRTGGAANVGFQFASSRFTDTTPTVYAPKIDVYWASDSPTLQPVALVRGNGAYLNWSPATGGLGPYRDAVMADTPALFYRLNESGGPGVFDWSGNDRNGTAAGTVTFNQTGGLTEGDRAALFNGSTGYVSASLAPQVAGSWSLEAWVYPTTTCQCSFVSQAWPGSGPVPYAMGLGNGLGTGTGVGMKPWAGFFTGSSWQGVVGPSDLPVGAWSHVVGTFNGTTAVLYVNGTQVASATTAGSASNTTQPLYLAKRWDAPGTFFPGAIDEAAIFPGALSSARVSAHYTAGTQAYPSVTSVEVHRSASSGFTPSASTLVQVTSDPVLFGWSDTTAAPNTTYYYRLKSVKTDASSVVSNEIAATTPADGKARLTVQPGLVGQRASGDFIKNGDSALHGGYTYLEVGPAARTLVSFDDQRQIPAIANVTGAQLKLFAYGPGGGGTLASHRLTRKWSEGGTTWTVASPGVNWSTAGGDFHATADGTAADTGSGPHWVSLDVTDMAQKWIGAQASQFGTLVKWQTESGASTQKFIADGFAASIALRPKLEITYTDPSASTVAPVPVFSNVTAGQSVKGTAAVTATATDDSVVAQLEFLLDNVVKQTSSVLPATWNWNTTTASRGTHVLKVRATDDAGNVTSSADMSVTVANSNAPTVAAPSQTSAGSGNFTVSATASDDFALTKVEFLVDGERFATDTTAPYSVTLPTLSFPVYDGSHVLTARAYDGDGNATTSAGTSFNPGNTTGTKYRVSITTTTVIPPEQRPADGVAVTYAVQNTGTVTIPNASTVLRAVWLDPTGVTVATSSNVALGGDITAGTSRNVSFTITPPSLPTPFMRGRYTLRVDLYDTGASVYFAAKGNKPYELPVTLTKQTADELGLERYQMFSAVDAGAFGAAVNLYNDNLNLALQLFNQPGIGLNTMVNLSYNTLEQATVGPFGNGWLLSAGLLPLGERLDIHPNAADTAAGRTTKWVGLVDGDGSYHRFDHVANDVYAQPKGVHLFARRANLDASRVWGFTKPDRTTYWFDANGWPTKILDGDGNALTFTHETPPANEDLYGVGKRLTTITDQGGRAVTFTYYNATAASRKAQAGRLKTVTDHANHTWTFTYYDDGNLLRVIQNGGTNWDGAYQADRSLVLTYTNSAGTAAATPVAANRVNPDPTITQGTLLFSVTDWKGTEATFTYSSGRFDTATSRVGLVTDFGWNGGASTATVALPGTGIHPVTNASVARTYTYVLDGEGKVTSITDPLGQVTQVQWATADHTVSQITEPGGHVRSFTYNQNGYLKTKGEQLNATQSATTSITYQDLAVDALDVSGNWPVGRTIGHLSQPTKVVQPLGVSTTANANDYSTSLAYDGEGHVLTVTNDATSAVTTNTWNADGTLATQTLPNPGSGAPVTTYNTYDANGLPTRVTDAEGGVTKAAYRADGLPLWVQDPIHSAATNGATAWSTVYYYDTLGITGVSSSPKSSTLYPGQLVWSGDQSVDTNGNPTVERNPRYGRSYAAGSGVPASTIVYDNAERVTGETGARAAADGGPSTTATDYDTAGRPYRTTTPRGTATTPSGGNWVDDGATATTFDPLDRPLRVTQYAVTSTGATDPAASRTTVSCYDKAGDLRQSTAPRGASTVTACPAISIPSSYVYSPGATHTSKLEYDEAHRQIKTIQPNDKFTETIYDLNGQIVTSKDENGTATTTAYDDTGRATKTTQPYTVTRNVNSMTEYDPLNRVTKEISPRAYDTQGPAGPFTSYVTQYTYDKLNRQVKTTLPTHAGYRKTVLTDGAGVFWRLGEASGPTAIDEKATYNATYTATGVILGQTGAVTASGDTNTAATFNGTTANAVTTGAPAFDAGNFTLEAWIKTASTGTIRTFVRIGDSPAVTTAGRVKLQIVADNRIQFWSNDGTTIGSVFSSGTVTDNQWHHVVGTRSGNTLTVYVDGAQSGQTTSSVGDLDGTSPKVAIGSSVSTTGYHEFFEGTIDEPAVYTTALSPAQIANHFLLGKGRIDPTQAYVHQSFDANGRLTAVTLPTTQTSIGSVPSTDKSTVAYWDTDQIRSSTDPASQPVYFDYTAEGWQARRVPEVTGAPGIVDWSRVMYWTYLPDGLLAGLADIGGQRSKYTYDADGGQTLALEATGISGAVGSLAIDTSYDSLGQVMKVHQPDPTTANRWLAALYGYDPNGNLASFTDNRQEDSTGAQTAAGRISTFSYDVNDRPTLATDDFATPASATDDEQAAYTYTDDGLLATRTLSKNTAGGLVQGNKTTVSYFLNRQLKTLVNADGTNATVEQHTLDYVSAGVYLNGNKTSDVFQLRGPVSTAPCWSTTCAATWMYDARDRLVFENAGTGDTGTASPVNLMTLDTIGNVTFDSGSNQTRVYSAQRLISDGTSKYVYDAFGNVDCVTPVAYSWATCPASGSDLVKDYLYDFKNRLVGTRDYNAGTLTKSSDITIDPLDRPIRQVDTQVGGSATTTTLVYQGNSQLLSKEILSGATNSTRGYWYGGERERLTINDTTAGRLNYLYDPHGSVSLLLDQANAVKQSHGYSGYGGALASVTKNAAGFSSPNKYQYTGKRWDAATGSYDIGLRRYVPSTSRWLQQDLYYDALDNLGLSLDPLNRNRYLFTGANPVNYVEVDGHFATMEHLGGRPLFGTISAPKSPRSPSTRSGEAGPSAPAGPKGPIGANGGKPQATSGPPGVAGPVGGNGGGGNKGGPAFSPPPPKKKCTAKNDGEVVFGPPDSGNGRIGLFECTYLGNGKWGWKWTGHIKHGTPPTD